MAKRYNPTQDECPKLKLLIYGQPGSTKTRTAATAAFEPERLGKVLMLEAFGNPISIRDYPVKPDIITIETMSDFNDPYEWLNNGQNPDADYAKEFGLIPPYDTLIIDGLTEVQRYVIRKVSGTDYTAPGNLTTALGRQGFGQLLGTMLNWAVHFVKLDMNIIMTSLEASQQSADTGIMHRHPLIWGQTGNEIAGYMYMVVRVTNELVGERLLISEKNDPVTSDTNSVAFFKETPQYYAKDQYGIAVDHLTNPTIGKILDLIDQSRNKTSNPKPL
jgi:hypothetical protein